MGNNVPMCQYADVPIVNSSRLVPEIRKANLYFSASSKTLWNSVFPPLNSVSGKRIFPKGSLRMRKLNNPNVQMKNRGH